MIVHLLSTVFKRKKHCWSVKFLIHCKVQCLKKLHYISYISNTVRDIKKFETFRVEGGLSCKAKTVY